METLDTLNDAQRQAVTQVEGPVLVLAGPGSGKTRVLTYRVAHLINDVNLPPYNILAVTFTNKAAREMSERLANLIGPDKVAGLTVGTFHSICARFLRIDGEHVGLARDFVIFDEDDQKAVVKQLLKELELDDKRYRPGAVIGALSRAKNEMIGPEAYLPPTIWHEAIRRLYPRYQAALQQNNGVDFDDLLNLAVQLFQEHPAVLEKYQRRYVYLHVDEFQDTNLAQYTLVKLLAQKYRNLFCVGDEDQSIYGWRGADYRNVMRLREDFPDARVMLLEQNYRSTRTILDAAQGVIRRNRSRHPKNLWTENTAGTPLVIQEAYDEKEEAQFVADEIRKLERRGYKPGDFDLVVIPGGFAPDFIRRNEAMLHFVRGAAELGKLLAAICHGPWVLCSTTALRGKKATCFFAIKDDVINAGAKYVDEEVVRDGNVITSRKPDDLPAFMKTIFSALAGK